MSTIEDFKNAPVGATATRDGGLLAIKIGDGERCWLTPVGTYLDDEELMILGYTLDPSAPTTAREALDMAWELAHPVKEGQILPTGARYLQVTSFGLKEYTAERGFRIAPAYVTTIRTVEPLPLPDPKPDWIDAPAVLARLDEWDRDKLDVFTPAHGREGRWARVGTEWTFHWDELTDVTPLYPLAEGTLNGTEAPKGYTPSNSMGLKNEETGA